ncbi:MAG: MFS transporter, partial [Rhodospirillales bacterium]|nr:MFS transporter [Rhodospirillales bacterium]
QGIFNAFAVPAHFAMMPLIVERRDISAVMALQSACAQSARFLGPAIAAGFLVTLGAAWAFAFNAATFFIYVATLAFVHIDPKAARAGKQKSVLSDTIEGFAYAWNHTSVRMLILVATCSAFMLRPVIDLMPAFVGDVMGLGTEEGPVALAWLLSSTGASALIASLWLAQRNESSGLTHHMLLAFLVSGICIVLFSLQSNLILGVALMVVFGFSSSAANVSNQILLQIGLDDRIRARVMGIYSLTFRAVPAVGALVVGTLGSISSLPLPIMAGGGLSLVFWLWVRRRIGGGRLERSPGEAD